MAKVIMTCGKICSGKTTYSHKLRKENKAVLLSVDEITLALLGGDAGDKLDEMVEKTEAYFFEKSLEIIETGINVVMDWGLWTKAERTYAREFYRSHNVQFEIHYLEISDEEWKKRISARNRLVETGKTSAYYVDDGLARKVTELFEQPDPSEADIIIKV